ncbi:MAG TPA: hypothetical protein PKY96_07575, partial [Flavobacteriales bacterium]|nr:hypothetical protein [Flavobacteriales bacterium]
GLPSGLLNLRIVDATGRMVRSMNSQGGTALSVGTLDLQSGAYRLLVEHNGALRSFAFLVQH